MIHLENNELISDGALKVTSEASPTSSSSSSSTSPDLRTSLWLSSGLGTRSRCARHAVETTTIETQYDPEIFEAYIAERAAALRSEVGTVSENTEPVSEIVTAHHEAQAGAPLSSLVNSGTQVSVSLVSTSQNTIQVEVTNGSVQVSASHESQGVQTHDVPTYSDQGTQTFPVGAVGRWRRLVTIVRRVSFLRRTRHGLNEYVRSFDGIYARAVAGTSSSSSQ